MCGGFVAAYADGGSESARARALSHATYNAGRLVTYLTLGALAGSVGHAFDLAGRAAGLGHAAALVTAGVLVLSGLWGLVPRRPMIRLGTRPRFSPFGGLSALLVRFRSRPPAVRAAVLGLSSTLLPCGWLYAFAAFAAGSGSARSGAFVMSAFWAGSLPMLLGLGVTLQGAARRLERFLPRARAALVLAVGAFTLVTRMQLPAFAAATNRPATTNGAAMTGALPGALPNRADCPCHRGHGPNAAPTPPFGASRPGGAS
jgi:hypothetical protein